MRRGRPRHDDILTPREWQVLDLLREDLTNEQIAERLGISPDTAKFHVSEILGKLGVQSRQEAAAWRGRPRVRVLGLGLPAALGKTAAGVSPLRFAGAGAIVTAGVALVLLALGVLMSNGDESLGKIAFVRDGNIWVQELPDGTPRQVTHSGSAHAPRWSPSGDWLLYQTRDEDADTPPGIQTWVVKADGSSQRQLANNTISGSWAPGDRIAYFADGEKAVVENADGGRQTTLYEAFVDRSQNVITLPLMPSPDGSKHIFLESRTARVSVGREPRSVENSFGVANSDGSDQRPVISYVVGEHEPIVPVGWSSDGSHVLFAFLPENAGQAASFYAVPAGGGERRPSTSRVHLAPLITTPPMEQCWWPATAFPPGRTDVSQSLHQTLQATRSLREMTSPPTLRPGRLTGT